MRGARTGTPSGPARRPRPARALEVLGQGVLAVVGACLLVLLLRSLVAVAGLPVLPVAPQLLAWSLVLVVRLDVVQRRLGGGHLGGRSALRQVLGAVLVSLALVSGGVGVLVPAACVLVVAVHAQWDEHPSAAPGALATVVLTGAAQVAAATGAVGSLVPAVAGALVALVLLLLALATSTNLVVVARQRRAASASLEAERERRDAELVHAVDHDPLTGALGRRGLGRHLETLEGGRVAAGTAGLVLDLDGFKPVNDRYGHAVGDAVLVAVVGRLRAALPAGALLARTGGDEFVAVVPGVPGVGAARAVADRLEGCLAAPLAVSGRDVVVGVSVGVSWAAESRRAEDLLLDADDAMYAAKRARRPVQVAPVQVAPVPAAPARPGSVEPGPVGLPRPRETV